VDIWVRRFRVMSSRLTDGADRRSQEALTARRRPVQSEVDPTMSIIEVSHLEKRYGEKIAVADVSFSVEEGEIFGILGPNGAGKTTTVECVAGLRDRSGGSVSVLGYDPHRQGVELREVLGLQLQDSALPAKLRVGEALELYSSFYSRPADWRSLAETLGLLGMLETRYAKLSGGQKQRLSIALALIGDPRIAVLDELTTGLDPTARRDTWALIEGVRDRGVTILLVTHLMEEAERLCDRVALIDAGRTVAVDTPGRLAERAGGLQRLSFRPSISFDDALLLELGEVRAVEHRNGAVTVTGSGDLFAAVAGALARAGVVAGDLRIAQSSLEDAFVALTDHHRGPADGRPETISIAS
jgi:ABC-2 type transport system ATP-binding protein